MAAISGCTEPDEEPGEEPDEEPDEEKVLMRCLQREAGGGCRLLTVNTKKMTDITPRCQGVRP